jgi:hypothetical protein
LRQCSNCRPAATRRRAVHGNFNRDFIGFVAKMGIISFSALHLCHARKPAAITRHWCFQTPSPTMTVGRLPAARALPKRSRRGRACLYADRAPRGRHDRIAACVALRFGPAHRQWVDDVKPKLNALLAREIETSFARYASELYDNVAALHRKRRRRGVPSCAFTVVWSLLCRRQS